MDRAGMQPESFTPDPFADLVGLPQTKHSKILIVVEMLWYKAILTLTSRTHHSLLFCPHHVTTEPTHSDNLN